MKSFKRVVVILLAVAVIGGGVYVWANDDSQPVSFVSNSPTMKLEKTDLKSYISATGAVESASSTNIYPPYSVQTYPIMEVLVDTGDAVKKGDVLARLDMSRLRDEIDSAELSLRDTQAAAAEAQRANANAVETAETALTTSRLSLEQQMTATANAEKDLRDAEADLEEPFDSYTYDKVIDDALVSLQRAETDLETARKDLAKASEEEFNDFQFQTALRDAEIRLTRVETDIAEAQNDVDEAQRDLDEELADTETFDAYTYQNMITDAKKAHDRAKTATKDAKEAIDEAEDYYNELFYSDTVPDAAVLEAEKLVSEAEAAHERAKKAEEDAKLAYDRAVKDRDKAEEDFNKNIEDVKSDTVEALERAVRNATIALNNVKGTYDDAQRAYDDAAKKLADATKDFNDTVEDAVEAAQKVVTRAENTLADTRRAYEKALSDKEHAIEDYIEANEDAIERAERTYNDTQERIKTVQNELSAAQIRLNQAVNAPDNTETSIEIQQIRLKELYDNLAEGEIIATADGVITERIAQVGALPSGILFVIEDTDDLHVTANIKEYSLSQVSVGQRAVISTDATGDTEYEAVVDYISPKAVTPAGSTSVEFEIQASFDAGANPAVRIGMNAFVDIVLDSREGIYAVALSAIVTDENGSRVVYTPAENAEGMTAIPVTEGMRNASHREISGEGLSDGLEIILQPEALPTGNMPMGVMIG